MQGDVLQKHDRLAVARIRVDLYLMGVTGLHPEAAGTIVLATREKLGAASPYRIVPMEELTGLVTEASAGEDGLAPFRRPGLDIVTA